MLRFLQPRVIPARCDLQCAEPAGVEPSSIGVGSRRMGPQTPCMVEAPFERDFSSREAEILREVPRRLAPLAPRLILLFGSRATGPARKDSDYDLLVVMDVLDPSQPRSAPVRRLLRGLGVPFDVVVHTSEEWAAYRTHPQSFAFQIAQSGKVLHEFPCGRPD